MSEGFVTQGTEIKRGDGADPTETFTKIAEIVNFSDLDGGTSDDIEATSLDSTAKEYFPGLKDSGEMTLDCVFVPSDAQQQGLRTDRDNQVVRNFEVVFSDTASTTANFSAYVKKFSISGGTSDIGRGSITLRVTGPVVWS